MTAFEFTKAADADPTIVYDGKPVPADAQVTLPASALAALVFDTVEQTNDRWRTRIEDMTDRLRPALEAARAKALASSTPAGGEAAMLRQLVNRLILTIESDRLGAEPRDVRIASMPARMTTRRVKRDQLGRIAETVEVEEDVPA
jgi:hypothetical protein